eukprot:COSAG04_NODE_31_length_35649_cov_21.693052_27_plen_99_part_00
MMPAHSRVLPHAPLSAIAATPWAKVVSPTVSEPSVTPSVYMLKQSTKTVATTLCPLFISSAISSTRYRVGPPCAASIQRWWWGSTISSSGSRVVSCGA